MKRAWRGAAGHADKAMNRLLERRSRARAETRPEGACLDAETFAAWTDGSLTAHQLAAAETHAADCDRCLAVLAAIAKASPPPSVTQGARWLSVRWLVPLTTAAVAITAWVVVQGPQEPLRPAPPPPASVPIDEAKPGKPAAQPEREVSLQTRADTLEKKPVSPPPSARSRDRAGSRRSADSVVKESTVAAAKPAAPLARAEARDQRLQSQARGAQLPRVIVSPDPNVRWRVAGPSVERSTDGGRTWRSQPTGAEVDLLAGVSPEPSVCWIVGRNGLVLLSTDGQSWRRLDVPDATIDLIGVTAGDSVTATVTAANGRRYHTTDAGRTWTLQENPPTPF